jgi:hypothetical protein
MRAPGTRKMPGDLFPQTDFFRRMNEFPNKFPLAQLRRTGNIPNR